MSYILATSTPFWFLVTSPLGFKAKVDCIIRDLRRWPNIIFLSFFVHRPKISQNCWLPHTMRTGSKCILLQSICSYLMATLCSDIDFMILSLSQPLEFVILSLTHPPLPPQSVHVHRQMTVL